MSIKKFISIWMGCQVFCFLILALFLLLSTDRLQSMTSHILTDAKAIEMAHRLENILLNERREDLLWRETGKKEYYTLKVGYMQQLDALIGQMAAFSTSEKEDSHLRAIADQFEQYKIAASKEPPIVLLEMSGMADTLLHEVELYREQNSRQMTMTLLGSDRLDALLDWWSIGLICFVFLVTIIGAALLKDRIIKPTFALSQSVVRFGKGEHDITTPVFRNDELGILSRAVNDMIANITRLQQERRYFFANLAHDIKNPLMLIGAAARRLKKKQAVAPPHTEQIERIIDQTESVEQLISELMDTVRIEDGNFSLDRAEVDLDRLARSVCEKQAAMISSHRLVYEGTTDCRISGDSRLLERVLTNLLSNAVKYSERGSTVTISLGREGNKALLAVRDKGAGIPPEQIDSLFQPFRRLSHTSKMAKGTGLGLFSVKKIIDGHGGTISVDSTPGRGTTVTVALCLAGDPPPSRIA